MTWAKHVDTRGGYGMVVIVRQPIRPKDYSMTRTCKQGSETWRFATTSQPPHAQVLGGIPMRGGQDG